MARKLPWNNDSASVETRATKTSVRQIRNPVRNQDEADQSYASRSTSDNPSRTSRKRRTSKSPSSSPPPQVPIEIEPMKIGYDKDDRFIMVEDEFQAVAQTYTAHLHRAEYKRLKQEAKRCHPTTLEDATSFVAGETKTKLQALNLHRKQTQAIDAMLGRSGDTTQMTEEDEEDNIDDPWSGTSLAKLTANGAHQKTSLKGLERLPSNTKAARGYGPNDGNDERKAFEKQQKFDAFFGASRGIAKNHSTAQSVQDESLIRTISRNGVSDVAKDGRTHNTGDKVDTLQRPKLVVNKTVKGSNRRLASNLRKKEENSKEKVTKSRLDEVPMFLL